MSSRSTRPIRSGAAAPSIGGWSDRQSNDPKTVPKSIRSVDGWDGSASPAEYASAYAMARAAIDGVDPRPRALVSLDQGGMTYASFISEMVAAQPGLAGHIDGACVLAAVRGALILAAPCASESL